MEYLDSPKLSIIVISYNTKDMTSACLASVFRETKDASFEIIILDNASSDGSADAIEEKFGKSIQLIRSKENLGFAGGNNRAISFARGEFVLLLNPDTVVLDNAIDKLLELASARPDAMIWGGKTVFGNGSLNPASCWGRQTFWSLLCQAMGFNSLFRRSSWFNPEGIGGWDRSGEREVDIVSGCFLLLRRDFWEQLGGFREAFFMYGEEADLCLRAKRLGARPVVSSQATIVHFGGASEKIRTDKLVKLLKAKMLLIKYHFPRPLGVIGFFLLAFWPLSRYVVHTILVKIGRKSSAENARAWGEVVARSREWWPSEG